MARKPSERSEHPAPEGLYKKFAIVRERRHFSARYDDRVGVDFCGNNTDLLATIGQHTAPRVNRQGMSVGFTPAFMITGLGRREDKAPCFNGSRPEQDFPVIATRRLSES